jgi:hypothetical protein
MPTSTRTKLQVVNSVLNSVGERALGTSGTQIGSIVVDCIREALFDLSTSASWNELRSFVGGTWSTDQCTLASNVVKIAGVYWYSSPTGLPESSYDYSRYPVQFVTLEEYLYFPLYPYTNSARNYPKYWTQVESNVVRVNPYPNDGTEQAKLTFDVYSFPPVPTNDSDTFTCSDFFVNLVQMKSTSLFSLKYLGDVQMHKLWDDEYEKLRRKQLVYQTGLPSGGYTMFRGRRNA